MSVFRLGVRDSKMSQITKNLAIIMLRAKSTILSHCIKNYQLEPLYSNVPYVLQAREMSVVYIRQFNRKWVI